MCMSQEERDSIRALVEESEETKTIAEKLLAFVQSSQEVPQKLRMIVGGGFVVEEPIKT